MITKQYRKQIIENFLEIIKRFDSVCGVILVGSSANDKGDEYSDIDLSVVVCDELDCIGTWKEINRNIKKELQPVYLYENIYSENNYLSLVFLKNFLEIDMGVTTLELLVAKRPNWQILFDKDGRVEEKMVKTSKGFIQKEKMDVADYLVHVLYHTRNFCVALKRGQELRAAKEIEDLRNNLLDLIGKNKNIVVKHFRDVDRLEDKLKEDFKKCYLSGFDVDSLNNTFDKLIDMYFDQVRERFRDQLEIDKICEYLKGMRISFR